jgi:hypothetical protein
MWPTSSKRLVLGLGSKPLRDLYHRVIWRSVRAAATGRRGFPRQISATQRILSAAEIYMVVVAAQPLDGYPARA